MSVSIIIPSLREEHAKGVIDSIDIDAQVIVKDTPGGSLNGIREGYKEAVGEYIIFVPDDIRFRPGSLKSILDFIKGRDNVQASFVLPDYKGLSSVGYYHFARWQCIKKSFADSIGGIMSEGYKHHFGDADLSIRVWSNGSVEACPDAVIDSLCIEDEVKKGSDSYYEHDHKLFRSRWPNCGLK